MFSQPPSTRLSFMSGKGLQVFSVGSKRSEDSKHWPRAATQTGCGRQQVPFIYTVIDNEHMRGMYIVLSP